jgi:hypothetical protein
MGAAAVVPDLQSGCRLARAEDLRRRLGERARLGVAVRRPPNCVPVDPERNVVEEEAPVHLGYVDPALDAVSQGVERADEIRAVNADVEGEVVTGTGGDTDERKVARERGRRRDGERPVSAGDAERVRPVRHGLVDERLEVVAGAQDDHVDAALACPFGEAGAGCLAAARPRVDKQHGPLWRIRRRPDAGRHAARRSRSDRRDCSVGGS